MIHKIKHLLLYFLFIVSIVGFFHIIDNWSDKNHALQTNLLLHEAKTLYEDQINTRQWNAQYGGVFVKPHKGEKPNPYLKNNILKVDENLTLIKINPAFMTRQLSELSDNTRYDFRITGLKPTNPTNAPKAFELRALQIFKTTTQREYYEFDKNGSFNYMGALITTKSCLSCHADQGYKIGDIKGGISIKLNTKEHNEIIKSVKTKTSFAKVFIFIFLLIIMLLLNKQLNSNVALKKEVSKRTLEIESTKDLMQKILDADTSFLFLTDKEKIVFTNKTVLDFSGYASLEDFKKHFGKISAKFEKVDDEDFLKSNYDDIHWIDYLYEKQNERSLKVLILHHGIKMYFKPHAKKILSKGKILFLVSFDIITNEYEELQALEEKASIDHLTSLLNRGKFDDILTKEIDLSKTVNTPLSIIFLDIDHFKKVNDTLGHNVGDSVLIELSSLLKSNIRRGDYVGRWGGEEFIIALQATTKKEAGVLAEKIRQSVQSYKFTQAGKITISLGVTQFIHTQNKDDLIHKVDEALYDAKESGRNKVVIN